ncbi:hypothetical protein SAMD00019534_014000 [Acytostelium subglobosum LB1]|uniref:hypothetical protein n=1 Tax=Acytostelium subglobosum LB1 TaxID=1410327 RepID=UPI000644C8CF|nr:hypothetical protein SAMD00019534_014000 [Acytostelium subglobosum LB1]GAM18225.1 hypothetical protein SAMD00019534_014000 [Acytostelium subglobosum LB1]|eukprot:XP_012758821.1 hypothetical protein SAMD00019534_014000 [Acytostelium subglobosum LB1]
MSTASTKDTTSASTTASTEASTIVSTSASTSASTTGAEGTITQTTTATTTVSTAASSQPTTTTASTTQTTASTSATTTQSTTATSPGTTTVTTTASTTGPASTITQTTTVSTTMSTIAPATSTTASTTQTIASTTQITTATTTATAEGTTSASTTATTTGAEGTITATTTVTTTASTTSTPTPPPTPPPTPTPTPPPTYSVNGFAFLDSNKNGIFEAGEAYLDGITVELTNEAGSVLGSGPTDASKARNGYSFTGLVAGKYCLKMTPPYAGGYLNGPTGTDNNFDPTTCKYCFDLNENTVDASKNLALPSGFVASANKFVVLGYAWNDLNSNGADNSGEPYLGGMAVTLTDKDGKQLATSTTDASLKTSGYKFENLDEGDYCLMITDPNSIYSNGPAGTSNKFDTDGKYCFNLGPSTVNANKELVAPAGFTAANPLPKYTLYGYAWNDLNSNGEDNSGEPYLGGMQGILYSKNKDDSLTEVKKFTTSAAGGADNGFRIPDLDNGAYCIKMSDPSDVYSNGPTGVTNKFDLTGQYCFSLDDTTTNVKKEMKVAAGFNIPKYNVVGYAWIDSNSNGQDNGGEPWLGGITFTLLKLDKASNTYKQISSQVSDASKADDSITFPNLDKGSYCVKVTNPSGNYKNGPKGGSNNFNSTGYECFDFDPTTGSSPSKVVKGGFIPDPAKTQPKYKATLLKLVKGPSTQPTYSEVGTQITDAAKAAKAFEFTNLDQGGYCVHLTDESGNYVPSIIGVTNKFNSTGFYCFSVDPTTTTSPANTFHAPGGFVLGSGKTAPKFSLRGYTWIDANKDGIDANHEVYLYKNVPGHLLKLDKDTNP